jgi:putative GTP pyrophosphokinase
MKFPTLLYSKAQVNKAGKILITTKPSEQELQWAHTVLSNWRACHGHPINTFQALLRKRIKKVSGKAFAAQRLKRTPSIIEKLKRFDSMQLARMQDIGGLRAVTNTINQVNKLHKEYITGGQFKHELVSEKNYITNPKSDGYRGIHLVFRYKNTQASEYNGLHLELQLRTKLQHAWATAVETMSSFLGQALKSRKGERKWLQFFEIVSSAFAFEEKTTLVPGYENLTEEETFIEVSKHEARLGVLDKLRAFSVAVNIIDEQKKKGSYHLVILNFENRRVRIKAYSRDQLEKATKDYSEEEKRADKGEQIEVVLVSAGPIEALKRAYPNYFLDTDIFIKKVEKILMKAWEALKK